MTSQRLAILVVSNCPLDPNQGSGYVILGFCREMRKRGHSVSAFGPEDYLLFPSLLPAKRLRLFVGYTLKALQYSLFSASAYDLVELWGAPAWLSIVILRLARWQHRSIVSRSNGLEPHFRQASQGLVASSPIRRFLSSVESRCDAIGFRSAHALTVVSSYDEEFAIRRRYQKRDRLLKIENPLPDQWLNRNQRDHFETPTIGFIGSWNPNKGNGLLVSIINLVHQHRPDCQWIIAGVGPDGGDDLTDSTPRPAVHIFPQVEKKQLEDLYSQMTHFLCLSRYESFGLVCAEAMSFGCALVSTSVGFMHGLKQNDEYVPIERLDPVAIADLLLTLLSNPGFSMAIAHNGYRRVQSLKWDAAAEQLEQFYFNLRADKPRQRVA